MHSRTSLGLCLKAFAPFHALHGTHGAAIRQSTPPPSISFVNHAKCLLVYEKGKSCTRWVRSSVSRHQSGGLVRILRLSLNLPGIKVNEITVKPVAVIIQQVVSLHTEARDACLEIFEQRSHSFNASL